MKAIVNLNNYVEVKLNQRGIDVFRIHWYKVLGDNFSELYKEPVDIGDGWYRFQIWEFMYIFGKYSYNGCTPCFEMNVNMDID